MTQQVADLERRVAELERIVGELREELQRYKLDSVVGCITDVEAFDEAMKYAREFRESDRPVDAEAKAS